MPFQMFVDRCLSRALRRGEDQGVERLAGASGFVVFSDLHKGAGDGADDFRNAKPAYIKALKYYREKDYRLVLDGDVEDIWESDLSAILDTHPETFVEEAEFHRRGRLIRIIGNHDNYWLVKSRVEKVLGALFPSLLMRRELLLEIPLNDRLALRILVVHGHEATLDSYYLAGLAQVAVKVFWRVFQNLTGKGRTRLSKNYALIAGHDTRLYRWTCRHAGLILVAGHTHRPVWCSQTHLEKLLHALRRLQSRALQGACAATDTRIQKLRDEIGKRLREAPPSGDTVKTRPSYFNAGCCSFEDGDITGIEIDAKEIRLVKWSAGAGPSGREVLEHSALASIYVEIAETLAVG